jgi:hypothetical protein
LRKKRADDIRIKILPNLLLLLLLLTLNDLLERVKELILIGRDLADYVVALTHHQHNAYVLVCGICGKVNQRALFYYYNK